MNDYIIIGDTEKYKGCLVCVCGPHLEHAKFILDRILNNPTPGDIRMIQGHHNLRIKEAPESECWWRGNLD